MPVSWGGCQDSIRSSTQGSQAAGTRQPPSSGRGEVPVSWGCCQESIRSSTWRSFRTSTSLPSSACRHHRHPPRRLDRRGPCCAPTQSGHEPHRPELRPCPAWPQRVVTGAGVPLTGKQVLRPGSDRPCLARSATCSHSGRLRARPRPTAGESRQHRQAASLPSLLPIAHEAVEVTSNPVVSSWRTQPLFPTLSALPASSVELIDAKILTSQTPLQ